MSGVVISLRKSCCGVQLSAPASKVVTLLKCMPLDSLDTIATHFSISTSPICLRFLRPLPITKRLQPFRTRLLSAFAEKGTNKNSNDSDSRSFACDCSRANMRTELSILFHAVYHLFAEHISTMFWTCLWGHSLEWHSFLSGWECVRVEFWEIYNQQERLLQVVVHICKHAVWKFPSGSGLMRLFPEVYLSFFSEQGSPLFICSLFSSKKGWTGHSCQGLSPSGLDSFEPLVSVQLCNGRCWRSQHFLLLIWSIGFLVVLMLIRWNFGFLMLLVVS